MTLLLLQSPVSSCLEADDLFLDGVANPVLLNCQVIVCLKIHPKLCRCAEVPRQAKGRIGGYSSGTVDNFVDPPSWDMDILGKSILTDFQGLQKLLKQYFARVDRC